MEYLEWKYGRDFLEVPLVVKNRESLLAQEEAYKKQQEKARQDEETEKDVGNQRYREAMGE